MSFTEPIKIIRQIVSEFEKSGIRYFIGGSLASSLYGIPRATQDIDIIAEIKNEHIDILVRALGSEFYIDEEMIRDALKHYRSFNIIHLETMYKVDIFILKTDKVSQLEMVRRERFPILPDADDLVYLASPEDTILHKLQWFLMGGCVSDRQWRDVLGVLKVQHTKLNFRYLDEVAQQRGVKDLLLKVLKEANLGEYKADK
jgi:hypothetical protein